MMKSHREFKLFQTIFNFLFYKLIFDGDDFEHLLHVEDKILEVAIFFNDLIDREGDPSYSLSPHIVGDLILLGNKIGDLEKIINFVGVISG